MLYVRRLKTQKIIITILRLLLLAGFFVLWEIASEKEWINSFVFSSPVKIWDCLLVLLKGGELLHHIRITLMETFVSFGLVMGIGVAAAVLLWLCTFLFRVLEPFLVMLNSLPKTALAPLLIVWLGNSMRTIIVAAVSVAVFGAALSLYTGFVNMDEDQIRLIYTLGGNKWDVLTKVILPGNIPLILSTMKVNLGLSLVGVIIGEFLAANEGLGYLIIYGSQVFRLDMVILSILLLCVIAFVLYGGIQILEKRLSYNTK
ncbi:MAG: ABC transporter permease [Lachnospiraceae bacterium]|nr:ABC transporter permease [Lachnospiraceae bacterium]